MSRKPILPVGSIVLVLGLNLGTAALGQERSGAGTDPVETRSKPGRLAELRGDDPILKSEASRPAAKSDPKKVGQAVSPTVGFFGDTRKFTRMGGWGSFGNAMGQFGFARATLIALPPVQEELKLTDEQKKKVKEWQEGMRKKGEEMGRSMREKNGGDPFKAGENQSIATRIFQFTSMMEQVSSFVKENESGLAKILNAAQRKRLNQISLQMEGISALTRPEIAEELGLLEEDQEQIRQILNQSRAQQMTTWVGSMMAMRPPRKPGNDPNDATADPQAASTPKTDNQPSTKINPAAPENARAAREKAMKQGFESMRDRTDQIHAQATKQIINVLSKAQRARFEILLGPPFDPSKLNELGRPPQKTGTSPPAESKPSAEKKPNPRAD